MGSADVSKAISADSGQRGLGYERTPVAKWHVGRGGSGARARAEMPVQKAEGRAQPNRNVLDSSEAPVCPELALS